MARQLLTRMNPSLPVTVGVKILQISSMSTNQNINVRNVEKIMPRAATYRGKEILKKTLYLTLPLIAISPPKTTQGFVKGEEYCFR